MNNQAAITLLKGLEQSLDDYCELNDEGKTAFRMAITALELFGNSEQLPSAQPEPLKITIDHEPTPDELERLKQAMRNTPVMLLPSAQPEIIRCAECKWYGRADKRRFYRGMDCLQKHIDTIVPDRDFCSKAERRTDGSNMQDK